jgi:hypothetical protein
MISANLGEKKIMGGFGSGRGQGGKDTTSDMQTLDIRRLQRDGLLDPGRAFGWQWTRNGEQVAIDPGRTEVDRVMLSYRSRNNGGEWQPMEYPVDLEWTPCHLRAERRAWFRLPGKRMRAARGDSLRRYDLRLSTLLPSGL